MRRGPLEWRYACGWLFQCPERKWGASRAFTLTVAADATTTSAMVQTITPVAIREAR
jgi:hypothetical protein